MKSKFLSAAISLFLGSLLCQLTLAANEAVLTAPGKITVGIISSETKSEFDAKIKSFFSEQWQQCGNCELRNLSTYDEKGQWSEKDLAAQLNNQLSNQLNNQGPSLSLLFVNFNRRYKTDENKTLVEAFKKISDSGTLIIGTAGFIKEGEISAPLSRTLLGQVPELIFIGEMNDRERMLTSFFGPEMLTVVRAPKEFTGKELGPAYFVAKFALHYKRRPPKEWVSHFRMQKAKSRRIWPLIEDFFSR